MQIALKEYVYYCTMVSDDFEISQIRAEYKKQAHLHDVLIPCVLQEENRVVVSLQDEKGTVYMNAEFIRIMSIGREKRK